MNIFSLQGLNDLKNAVSKGINPEVKQAFGDAKNALKTQTAPLQPVVSGIAQESKKVYNAFADPVKDMGASIQKGYQNVQTQAKVSGLYKDELDAYNEMKNDGLSDEESFGMIKERRAKILEANGIDGGLTDYEIKQLDEMKKDGIGAVEASGMLKAYRSKFKDRNDQIQTESSKNLEWWQKAGLQTTGLVAGTLETVGSSSLNLAGWTADLLGADSLGQSLKNEAKAYDDAGNESFANDKNFSTGNQIGNAIGGTAMMLSAPTVGGSATSMAGKILGGATTGGLQMGATDIANKGETSLGSVATGIALGGALPIVGKGLGKVKNYITDKLPKTLIAKGMTTPTALKNASERLSKLSDDGILNIDDAPQWMLDKGLKGSKDEIAVTLQDVVKDATKLKGQMFAQNTNNYAKETVVKDLQGALKEIMPMFMKGKNPRAGSEKTVAMIKAMISNKNVKVQDIDAMRSVIGDLGIFTKTGDMADSVAKEGLQTIWINASKFLDDTLPGFRVANKDIEVAIALRKAIGLKEAQDATRSLLTLPNITLGGIGAGYGYSDGGGIEGAVKGLALGGLGIGLKSLMNNPRFTTYMAQKLKNIGTGPVSGSINSISSQGANKLIIPSVSNSSGQEEE